jgi:hypothetical protein
MSIDSNDKLICICYFYVSICFHKNRYSFHICFISLKIWFIFPIIFPDFVIIIIRICLLHYIKRTWMGVWQFIKLLYFFCLFPNPLTFSGEITVFIEIVDINTFQNAFLNHTIKYWLISKLIKWTKIKSQN